MDSLLPSIFPDAEQVHSRCRKGNDSRAWLTHFPHFLKKVLTSQKASGHRLPVPHWHDQGGGFFEGHGAAEEGALDLLAAEGAAEFAFGEGLGAFGGGGHVERVGEADDGLDDGAGFAVGLQGAGDEAAVDP